MSALRWWVLAGVLLALAVVYLHSRCPTCQERLKVLRRRLVATMNGSGAVHAPVG